MRNLFAGESCCGTASKRTRGCSPRGREESRDAGANKKNSRTTSRRRDSSETRRGNSAEFASKVKWQENRLEKFGFVENCVVSILS